MRAQACNWRDDAEQTLMYGQVQVLPPADRGGRYPVLTAAGLAEKPVSEVHAMVLADAGYQLRG